MATILNNCLFFNEPPDDPDDGTDEDEDDDDPSDDDDTDDDGTVYCTMERRDETNMEYALTSMVIYPWQDTNNN